MLLYIGLGSNLGDRVQHINAAIALIAEAVGPLVAQSALIETDPVDMDSTSRFVNAAAAFETRLSPLQLLDITQDIERRLGRTRKSVAGIHYDRTIDIDLLRLVADDGTEVIVDNPRLTLPHPHIAARPFVHEPLDEVMRAVGGREKPLF